MENLLYVGKVRLGTSKDMLMYHLTGEGKNGLIQVTHVNTGDVFYYTKSEFHKLFKTI